MHSSRLNESLTRSSSDGISCAADRAIFARCRIFRFVDKTGQTLCVLHTYRMYDQRLLFPGRHEGARRERERETAHETEFWVE